MDKEKKEEANKGKKEDQKKGLSPGKRVNLGKKAANYPIFFGAILRNP